MVIDQHHPQQTPLAINSLRPSTGGADLESIAENPFRRASDCHKEGGSAAAGEETPFRNITNSQKNLANRQFIDYHPLTTGRKSQQHKNAFLVA